MLRDAKWLNVLVTASPAATPEERELLQPSTYKSSPIWSLHLLLADPGESYAEGLAAVPRKYFGTRKYMAPELDLQLQHPAPALSPTATSYTLGVMLAELRYVAAQLVTLLLKVFRLSRATLASHGHCNQQQSSQALHEGPCLRRLSLSRTLALKALLMGLDPAMSTWGCDSWPMPLAYSLTELGLFGCLVASSTGRQARLNPPGGYSASRLSLPFPCLAIFRPQLTQLLHRLTQDTECLQVSCTYCQVADGRLASYLSTPSCPLIHPLTATGACLTLAVSTAMNSWKQQRHLASLSRRSWTCWQQQYEATHGTGAKLPRCCSNHSCWQAQSRTWRSCAAQKLAVRPLRGCSSRSPSVISCSTTGRGGRNMRLSKGSKGFTCCQLRQGMQHRLALLLYGHGRQQLGGLRPTHSSLQLRILRCTRK